jgi:hypothetical protein
MVLEDIDFENFQVESTRAGQIRDLVQRIKTENWVLDLKTLTHEMGSEETSTGNRNNDSQPTAPSLPGFSNEIPSQVFRLETANQDKWVFIEQGQELFVFKNNEVVLETTSLPKANEFVVLYVNDSQIESLVNLFESELKNVLKESKAKKAARAASFKAKFIQDP